jgi:hypothetical protein
VPGATHLFEEPGALEQVATLARDSWSLCIGMAPICADATAAVCSNPLPVAVRTSSAGIRVCVVVTPATL